MHRLEICEIKVETSEAKTFLFKTEIPLVYNPGQFLTFLFERRGIVERRSYSFSSSPDVSELPAITIKRTANGTFSRWWLDEARVGDIVFADNPAGVFSIAWKTQARDIFLAAAGSGITPLFSILKSALVRETNSKVHLLYSNSNITSAIFYTELVALEKQFPQQLTIDWLFSNEQDLTRARLSTYNLQRIIGERLSFDMADAVVFTCGPIDYMQMVQITSLTMGIKKTNFRRELFDINLLPPPPARYVDKTDRRIKIIFNNTSVSILVKWSQSILEAALEQGLPLPFNCKAGRCSTCICKIVSGKIWMHYNEVLTDDDELNGFALTCTGHPSTDDLIIRID